MGFAGEFARQGRRDRIDLVSFDTPSLFAKVQILAMPGKNRKVIRTGDLSVICSMNLKFAGMI